VIDVLELWVIWLKEEIRSCRLALIPPDLSQLTLARAVGSTIPACG